MPARRPKYVGMTSAPTSPTLARPHGGCALGKLRLSRYGAHWFDRATGLNILLDEAKVPIDRWSRVPRYVSIALTNACELCCPFCYAPKVPARLDPDRIVGWAHQLDREGALGVGFGGGEPMAHPEFVRICAETAAQTSMAVTFTTHGHRVTPKLAASLRGSVHFIRVSMDGIGETYERVRGRSFAAFQRQLAIVASVAPFGLNVIVNDFTVGELDDIASFAGQVGATEVLLLPEQPVGDRPGISEAASQRLRCWVSRANHRVRLAISEAGVTDGMPTADPFPGESALEAHAHIDATGHLKANAYAAWGVPVGDSIVNALDELREGRVS